MCNVFICSFSPKLKLYIDRLKWITGKLVCCLGLLTSTMWNANCLEQWTKFNLSMSNYFLTGLASDDHGLHDECEKFIQYQMEKKDQRL